MFFSFCFFITCAEKKTEVKEIVMNLQKYDIYPEKEDKKILVIVPIEGCDACFNVTFKFIKNELSEFSPNSANFVVVFTKYRSLKYLNLTIGDYMYYHPSVIVDSLRYFSDLSKPKVILYADQSKSYEVNFENFQYVYDEVVEFLFADTYELNN